MLVCKHSLESHVILPDRSKNHRLLWEDICLLICDIVVDSSVASTTGQDKISKNVFEISRSCDIAWSLVSSAIFLQFLGTFTPLTIIGKFK